MEQQPFYTVRGYQTREQSPGEISPAMEDYLEMTARLCRTDGFTRINRISKALNVKPSSASKMTARLAADGYLITDANNCIHLTVQGLKLSEYLLDRHQTLETFLSVIGSADPLRETELIEHYLSPETIQAIKKVLPLLHDSTVL